MKPTRIAFIHLAVIGAGILLQSCLVQTTEPGDPAAPTPATTAASSQDSCDWAPVFRALRGSTCAIDTAELRRIDSLKLLPPPPSVFEFDFMTVDSRSPDSVRVLSGIHVSKTVLTSRTSFQAQATAFRLHSDFDVALGTNDTIELEIFAKSMLVSRGYYANDGALRLVRVDRDTLASLLLERLSKSSLPKTSTGLLDVYARALLAGDTPVAGFPVRMPKGLDPDKLREATLRLAATSGRPLSEIVATWGLDLDYLQAQSRILQLEPRISTADSIALFR